MGNVTSAARCSASAKELVLLLPERLSAVLEVKSLLIPAAPSALLALLLPLDAGLDPVWSSAQRRPLLHPSGMPNRLLAIYVPSRALKVTAPHSPIP